MTVLDFLATETDGVIEEDISSWRVRSFTDSHHLNPTLTSVTPITGSFAQRQTFLRSLVLVSATHPGVEAVDDLVAWTGSSIADVMQRLGLAEPTYYWWRKNPSAEVKPDKAGRVIRVHLAAKYLNTTLGNEALHEWWQEGQRASDWSVLESAAYATLESAQAPLNEFPTFSDEAWEAARTQSSVEGALLDSERAGPIGPLQADAAE